jgi:hypothetical protein
MVWDIFCNWLILTVKNNQTDPWPLVSFFFFFGRVGMEWPKINILKTHKLILETNEYECVALFVINRVYVKSQRNLSPFL